MNWELAQNNHNDAVPMTGNIELYAVFDRGQLQTLISKAQFESIIDGDDALSGYQGKVAMAYVVASRHQLVQAAVLFYLPLDEQGYVLDGWRLPLQRLADTAGRGPNLGGGRIRLACHSQCAISWHKDALWDPTTSTFVAIKNAVIEHQVKAAQARLMTALNETVDVTEPSSELDDVEDLRRTLRNETLAYRNQLQSLQQEIEKQRLLNERLHKQLETKQGDNADNRLDLTALRQQNQQLSMRVRELEVVNERLHGELSQHKAAGEVSSEVATQDEMIEQMAQAEMLSVVYHSGVGHINLAASQLLDYLDDPLAYAAHHVNLTKEQYLSWLEHHRNGKCQVCDSKIALIGDPRIFDAEVDVYCEQHQP